MRPKKKRFEPKYEVITYRPGKGITIRTLIRRQVQAINKQSVDYFFSASQGELCFHTASGDWIPHRAPWNGLGLGKVTFGILECLQENPGEWLTSDYIADVTGCTNLEKNSTLAQRVTAIRKALREHGESPHFILSRRAGGSAYAWSAERSWMRIARIPIRPRARFSGSD